MKLDDKKLKHKAHVEKLKDRIATLESESPLDRMARHDKYDDGRESELEEKNDHLKWLNSSLKDDNEKLKERVSLLKASNAKKREEDQSSKSAKNDKWRNVALQEQVAVLSQRVIELEETASAATAPSASALRRPPQSPQPSILHSPVIRSSLEGGSASGASRSSSAPKSALRVSTYDDANNQANHDLLSDCEDERGERNTRHLVTPPALPRPGSGSTSKSSLEKSKSSKRFSLRKRSSKDRMPPSPKYDDASNSTTNYDF